MKKKFQILQMLWADGNYSVFEFADSGMSTFDTLKEAENYLEKSTREGQFIILPTYITYK